MIDESDSNPEPPPSYNPNNQLIPIHYDTSFLDQMPDASKHNDQTSPNPENNIVKDEYILGQSTFSQCSFPQMQLQLAQEVDDDDDNFEIDHFFRMKPKEVSPHDPSNSAVKIEEVGETEMPIDLSTNKTAAESQISDANDIIQQAAIIDDDFFSQIRESMDVLYDKILC